MSSPVRQARVSSGRQHRLRGETTTRPRRTRWDDSALVRFDRHSQFTRAVRQITAHFHSHQHMPAGSTAPPSGPPRSACETGTPASRGPAARHWPASPPHSPRPSSATASLASRRDPASRHSFHIPRPPHMPAYSSPPARLRRGDHRLHLGAREAEHPRDRRRLEAGLERREHQPFLPGRHRSRRSARPRFRTGNSAVCGWAVGSFQLGCRARPAPS